MIGRLFTFITGESEEETDAVLYLALMVMGFLFGFTVMRLSESNGLLRDVRSYLHEQRRVAAAATARAMAAAKEINPDG